MISTIISAVAVFGLVYFGGIKLWNLSVAIGGGVGKGGTEPPFVDASLAICAAVLYLA